jgi:excisionase family DNA binding protein
MQSQLLTVGQAASELSVSVHTVRAWIAKRKIGSVRIGRAVRVPSHEIARLVERGTTPALDDRGRPVM